MKKQPAKRKATGLQIGDLVSINPYPVSPLSERPATGQGSLGFWGTQEELNAVLAVLKGR